MDHFIYSLVPLSAVTSSFLLFFYFPGRVMCSKFSLCGFRGPCNALLTLIALKLDITTARRVSNRYLWLVTVAYEGRHSHETTHAWSSLWAETNRRTEANTFLQFFAPGIERTNSTLRVGSTRSHKYALNSLYHDDSIYKRLAGRQTTQHRFPDT